MSDRLPSRLVATALIRRVHDAGGSAAVLARGEPTGGALLIITTERGQGARVWERGLGPGGTPALIESGPRESDDAAITSYWQRRVARDPDLWVIELDVAGGERFAAETTAPD